MCKGRLSACIICSEIGMNVIPCREKVEEACVVTLFSPSKCIRTYVFSISYHQSCMDKAKEPYGPMELKTINDKFKSLGDGVIQKAYSLMNPDATVVMLTDNDGNQILAPNSTEAP
jgi:hypothetical protein